MLLILEGETWLGTRVWDNFILLEISRLDSTLTVFLFLDDVGILIKVDDCLFDNKMETVVIFKQ